MRKWVAVGALVVAVVLVVADPAGAVDRAAIRRPGPLRVLLVGDSITYSYQDEAAAAFQAKGYQVFRFGVPSTGLLDRDWCHGQIAKDLLRGSDADVVVYENAGNYLAPHCSDSVAWATPGFFKQWTRSAKLSQRILTRRGARFLWVSMPPVTRPGYDTVTPRLTWIYRTLGAGMVETWGRFDAAMHTSDGMHLSQAGQDRFAGRVVSVVG